MKYSHNLPIVAVVVDCVVAAVVDWVDVVIECAVVAAVVVGKVLVEECFAVEVNVG